MIDRTRTRFYKQRVCLQLQMTEEGNRAVKNWLSDLPLSDPATHNSATTFDKIAIGIQLYMINATGNILLETIGKGKVILYASCVAPWILYNRCTDATKRVLVIQPSFVVGDIDNETKYIRALILQRLIDENLFTSV